MLNRLARLSRLGWVVFEGLLSGLSAAARADTNQGINIATLSSRPEIVSGGNRLGTRQCAKRRPAYCANGVAEQSERDKQLST